MSQFINILSFIFTSVLVVPGYSVITSTTNDQCFQSGECFGSSPLMKPVTNDEFECHHLCKKEELCEGFTFSPDLQVCRLYRNCEDVDAEFCPKCVSGNKNCREAYTKVLVAIGFNGYHTNNVEVVDLSSTSTSCNNLPNFTYADSGVAAGLDYQDNPMICGGTANKSMCFVLQNGAWSAGPQLNYGRYGIAMTKSPFPRDGSKLFIVGGANLRPTEVLGPSGWQVSVPLPIRMYYLCMVPYNSTAVIAIGGYQESFYYPSANTYIFSSETNAWASGPAMNTPRIYHSCGLINRDEQMQQKSIIVAGGYNGGGLSSVEILDIGSNAWRSGPELPFSIEGGVAVEDPLGASIIIGGFGNGRYLDTLFRLPHGGVDATWEELPQKLRTGREHAAAILVPDVIVDCA